MWKRLMIKGGQKCATQWVNSNSYSISRFMNVDLSLCLTVFPFIHWTVIGQSPALWKRDMFYVKQTIINIATINWMPDTGWGPLYILALVYTTNHRDKVLSLLLHRWENRYWFHFPWSLTGLNNGLDILSILIGSWSAFWFCLAKGWQWRTDIVSPLTVIPLASIIFHMLIDRKWRSVRKSLIVWKKELIMTHYLGLV